MNAGPGSRLPGWGQWRRHATGSRADAAPASRSAATLGARAAVTAAALAATLGLAAVCWVVAVRQMNGMDMRLPPGVVRSGYLQACGWR